MKKVKIFVIFCVLFLSICIGSLVFNTSAFDNLIHRDSEIEQLDSIISADKTISNKQKEYILKHEKLSKRVGYPPSDTSQKYIFPSVKN